MKTRLFPATLFGVIVVVGRFLHPAALAEEPRSPGDSPCHWKTVDGVKIPIPPPEHPRLYLRAAEARKMKKRLADPALDTVVRRIDQLARRSPQFRVEWGAVHYLAEPNRNQGREIIRRTLDLLKKSKLPDRNDACRVTGRMMVTGAVVYDWLYDLLTPDERQAFIAELVRVAKTQECGYPPARQGSVTGHSSEAMIMRDMISAGIAIYDEYPEMYELCAGRFFREHLPARNWLYNGHAYHQGDSYGPYRFSWDTFPLLIFDRLGAGNVYNPEQRWVPYFYLYSTRPDGQRLRAGDTFMHSRPRGQPWGEGIGPLLTASYYGDGVLLGQYLRQGGNRDNEALFEFLWRDANLKASPLGGLPLSRYFGSPFGWMIARTGWGDNAVVAEMKINEYNFANHQHLDAGAFQIYYKGPLAIDSGLYTGSSGRYGSPHCKNYYWRTVAHNSLLVHDPKEEFGTSGYGNDGGQRLPNRRSEARTLDVLLSRGYRTGHVLTHGFGPDPQTPDFTLLQGDITQAYSDKVRQVLRSFVFLKLDDAKVPAAMVVFDRVVSARPSFRKSWLLHTLEEPQLRGTSAIVDAAEHGERGRLVLDVLLPDVDNVQIEAVGGPGKEFWVFGTNYANDVEPGRLQRSSMEPGAWRIEVSPKAPAREDLFLNVMQMTDRNAGTRLPVRRLQTAERVGCFIESPRRRPTLRVGARLVSFRRDGRRSGEPVAIEVPAGGADALVADLQPGVWYAQCEGESQRRQIHISEQLGAAWLELRAGKWTLHR